MPPIPPMPPISGAPAPAAPALEAGRIPFNRIRKLTADHMVSSKATSPHVLQAVEVDFAGVDRARKAVKESWKAKHGYSLTYLPFIAHAVCAALREFPHANASVGDNELILHGEVNLAIAIDLGADGLVAPVIHKADSLSVAQLAASIHDLATRARNNRLTPDDFAGGNVALMDGHVVWVPRKLMHYRTGSDGCSGTCCRPHPGACRNTRSGGGGRRHPAECPHAGDDRQLPEKCGRHGGKG